MGGIIGNGQLVLFDRLADAIATYEATLSADEIDAVEE
jgi:hypothetical protein